MAKEWIESLAQEIKQKNHEAAEDYGRAQHNAGIVSTSGKPFFTQLIICLQENVNDLRSQLQGDLTASDTTLQTINPNEAKINRSRFPWVDANLTHRDDTVVLDYAKSIGLAADPKLDRKTVTFNFQVAPDDSLFVQDAFLDPPQSYAQPELLARRITEILFSV
jgi:hypothetical protein